MGEEAGLGLGGRVEDCASLQIGSFVEVLSRILFNVHGYLVGAQQHQIVRRVDPSRPLRNRLPNFIRCNA